MTRTPAPAPTKDELARRLRAWVAGGGPVEAGVELLIRSGLAARHDVWEAFGGWDQHLAWLEADLIAGALDELALSTGEAGVLRIAASLLAGVPVDLARAVGSLDDANSDLVAAAVTHAAGHGTYWP